MNEQQKEVIKSILKYENMLEELLSSKDTFNAYQTQDIKGSLNYLYGLLKLHESETP